MALYAPESRANPAADVKLLREIQTNRTWLSSLSRAAMLTNRFRSRAQEMSSEITKGIMRQMCISIRFLFLTD